MTKPSIKLGPGALVCLDCDIQGDVTIGARSIVHPKARIIADAGPIIIGENNLIEERAEIYNRKIDETPNQTVVIIGNSNLFEVGCYSEALKIGDNNIIESKARLGRETELTNGCVVGAGCSIFNREVLQENLIISGSNCERRVQFDRPQPQSLQLDFLHKMLPNYHYIRKKKERDTQSLKN
ncbi:DgyrCDS4295 [Dimorphilus gyrociliatus]|uniref:Dynactin subunit 6 n=1 Tax=Dimorphilus gyrociliatus TaxID=2664684 RepID=A0A7I8VHZ6_9ANNE|nr:DgyrCDS4295 [Dimorphilus gyrociliatus]